MALKRVRMDNEKEGVSPAGQGNLEPLCPVVALASRLRPMLALADMAARLHSARLSAAAPACCHRVGSSTVQV